MTRVIFRRLRAELGIPEFTSLWLRHSYTVMCRENGIDADAASRFAGQSSTQTTMDIYSHLSQLAEQTNAAKVRNMFG